MAVVSDDYGGKRRTYMWNEETDNKLREMWAQRPDCSLVAITLYFGCSPGCIYNRAKVLGLPAVNKRRPRGPGRNRRAAPIVQEEPAEKKPRRCLRCLEDFVSDWAGHRVCPGCKKSRAWIDGAGPQDLYV